MARKDDPTQVIQRWLERDLSAAAAAGQLPPAFELEESLDQLREIAAAGRRPVITGDSGVGKTALVYEFVRRVHAGDEFPELRGRRFLQFSFRNRAASLSSPDKVAAEFQRLVEALIVHADCVVPFFRDFHLADRYDLEPQVLSLAYQFPSLILAEGEAGPLESLFEYTPEFNDHFVLLTMEEPSLERVRRILHAWSEQQLQRRDRRFNPAALERALQLSHRFLVRTRLPRTVVDFLSQMEGMCDEGHPIAEEQVIERFCRIHRTPRVLVDPAAPLDLAGLEQQFNRRVLGQPEAVRSVVNTVGVIKAGLSDARRPFGVFLFVGPTGVGKTHVAQLLAEYLFGGRDRMIRLNMADYPSEFDALVLFGNPNGNNRHEVRGVLTRRLIGRPFAVLLLDEFEKSHAKTHDRFLQLIDEGSFVNGAGESISCRATIIIATSNAGAELYRGETLGFHRPADRTTMNRQVDRILEKHFRFELLNRFDQIVHFHPLSREDIRTIARAELDALQKRAGLAQRGLALEVDEAVLDWLVANGYDPEYGARFLRRTIEREVTTALADAIVRENPAAGRRLTLDVRGNRVRAGLDRAAESRAVRKEIVALPLGTAERVCDMDGESLQSEALRLADLGRGRLAELEGHRREYERLLEIMNDPAFWTDAGKRAATLDRFRELDVTVQVEARLAQRILRLLEQLDRAGAFIDDTGPLARALESAATALREWDERSAAEGPGSVWMALTNLDPLHPAGDWIEELVEMETAWCRRLRLTTHVAAYALEEGALARVVLDVEGPGAAAYLAMEHGVHRLFRAQDIDRRIRIEIIPKRSAPPQSWPDLTSLKPRKGLFGLEITCRGRLDLVERGQTVEFLAANAANLSHLLHDLAPVWTDPILPALDAARLYAEDGVGARDPRTGAVIPRMKDVLKGNLDRFLEAWRRQEKGLGAVARQRDDLQAV